ncbi:MAG: hypothetical protein ACR2PK_18705 [Acidimicrobiales bacterium]
MTEDRVKQLLGSVETVPGAPSREYVERLGARLIAEALGDSSIDQQDHQLGEAVMIDLDTHESAETDVHDERAAWRLPAAIGVAAAVLLVIGLVALIANRDDRATVTTSLDADSALATSNSFLEAFNAGDVDGVLTLATDDVVSRDNFGDFDEAHFDRDEWEQVLEWILGQGTVLSAPSCEVTDNVGSAITVSCLTQSLDAAIQAAGSLPVETIVTLVVATDGITDVGFTYGATNLADVGVPYTFLNRRENFTRVDFEHAGNRFEDWLQESGSPDAGATDFLAWDSVESARFAGERRAELAGEWGAYLEDNGCGSAGRIPDPVAVEDVAQDTARMRCGG